MSKQLSWEDVQAIPKQVTWADVAATHEAPYGGKTLEQRQAESKAVFDAAQAPWYSRYFNAAGLAKAKEMTGNVVAGVPQAITGIPASIVATKDALNSALTGNLQPAERMATSITNPVMTPLKQAIELAHPGWVNAPTPDAPETTAAAQGAGALLGGAAIGEASEGFPTTSKVVAATPDALRAAGRVVTTPEALLTRAAGNRTPLPKANMRTVTGDIATTAVGYGIAGREGAAVAEALNLVRRSPMFRNAKASVQEAAARLLAGKSEPITGVAETAAPVRDIVSPPNPKVVAADEAARMAQAPLLPRDVYSGAKPVSATSGFLGSANPLVEIPRPGTPEFVRQQLDRVRQAETPQQLFDRMRAQQNAELPPTSAATTAPIIEVQSPSVPQHVQQQLADARLQSAHENYPGYGDFKPPPSEPSAPIPGPEFPKGGSPSPVTDRVITQVKQQLAPSAPSAKMSVGRYTPRLLQEMPELADPTLHGAYNQPAFDAKLFDGFKQREGAVIAAEDAVPDATLVVKKPIMDTIDETIAAAEKYANPKLTGTLERLKATWKELPDNIPWPDFVKAKRDFFNANNGNNYLVRQVYRALTDATSDASSELAAANKAYSIVRTAVDDAGIIRSGPAAGQRLRSQGVRPKATMGEQLRQSQPVPPGPPSTPPTTPSAPTNPTPSISPVERFAAFRQATAGKVGAALPVESRGLSQMIDARLGQIRDMARSGMTETTGKALGKAGREEGTTNVGTESVGRGGGMMNAFPELERSGLGGTSLSPKLVADAIDRHLKNPAAPNVVYDRVRKAVSDAMQAERESRPESGPLPMGKRLEQWRRASRQASSEPPF